MGFFQCRSLASSSMAPYILNHISSKMETIIFVKIIFMIPGAIELESHAQETQVQGTRHIHRMLLAEASITPTVPS